MRAIAALSPEITGGTGVAKHLAKEVVVGASEFQVFSRGQVGRMHVLVHQLTEEGRYELGHRVLGDWLGSQDGGSSEDVHMHWHMGVFELAMTKWEAAYARFNRFILPAIEHGDAATDAPAMLWRLRLDAPRQAVLPWEVARQYSIESLQNEGDRFHVLHDLLSLAGVGDISGLDQWLGAQTTHEQHAGSALVQLAEGLRAFANEDYRTAAAALTAGVPRLPEIGGSDAQHHLFQRINEVALERGPRI